MNCTYPIVMAFDKANNFMAWKSRIERKTVFLLTVGGLANGCTFLRKSALMIRGCGQKFGKMVDIYLTRYFCRKAVMLACSSLNKGDGEVYRTMRLSFSRSKSGGCNRMPRRIRLIILCHKLLSHLLVPSFVITLFVFMATASVFILQLQKTLKSFVIHWNQNDNWHL